MTVSEWLQVGTLGIVVLSALVLPFVLRALNRQDADREKFRTEMHGRLTHLDECVDDLKRRVLGELCSRAELATAMVNMTDALNRMRAAISVDTNGLHERIMRLESWRMDGGQR